MTDNDFSDILPPQAILPTFTPQSLTLKPNHASFPFYINYDTLIILETFHPLFQQATDFLIAIADPVSRPIYIHEYRLTSYSLYAAICVGLTTHEILATLDYFSKNVLPNSVIDFVKLTTSKCGKVKFLVKNNLYYFLVCDTVRFILDDPVVKRFVVGGVCNSVEIVKKRCVEIEYPPVEEFDFRSNVKSGNRLNNNVSGVNSKIDKLDDASISNVSGFNTGNGSEFKNESENINNSNTKSDKNNNALDDNIYFKNSSFQQQASSLYQPSSFSNTLDSNIPLVYPYYNQFDIDLKPSVFIRSYQEICLNKMFSSGTARSGIIVLPCGSGKTLVGITAICTMKHPTLILCTSSVSVEQWKAQLLAYTTIKSEDICTFTSDKKDPITHIVITTYTMLAYSGKRSRDAQRIINELNSKIWGLLILDEVHVVPANMFRRVVTIKHYTKLGLTATLVREDDRIEDLNFLIGPKLYEADWQSLSEQGHIAKVECIEIWCNMAAEFYQEYLTQNTRKGRLLSVMNPGKFRITDHLIRKHEEKGDKIIVFSDNVYALKAYALKLNKPFIYGPTGQIERMRILKQFQNNPMVNTIFLSKVGDTSIDLPEATCLIQISSHFGSRRQEAQRLGRILRAKRRNDVGFKVYFYSLVSKDTDEMYYSAKRQQFLVDQGYSFVVKQDLVVESNVFSTKQEEKELLASVLVSGNESEEEEEDLWKTGLVKEISGGEQMGYIEKRRKRM